MCVGVGFCDNSKSNHQHHCSESDKLEKKTKQLVKALKQKQLALALTYLHQCKQRLT